MRSPLVLCALMAVIATASDAQAPARTAADSALLRALRLPEVMQRARAAGVPDSTVRGILEAISRGGLPAHEAVDVVDAEVGVVERDSTKMANFGSFVRAQVESGARGQELAARIRAEHQRRGIGRPDHSAHPNRADRPGKANPRDTSRGQNRQNPQQPRRP